MDQQYKLTVYGSSAGNVSSHYPEPTWIELLDVKSRSSHIFNFIPGKIHTHMFGNCGFFCRKKCIPDNVHTKADIDISKALFKKMVKEGYSLHNRFLFYDDGFNGSEGNTYH